MRQLIVDNDGDWLINSSAYNFVDPSTGVKFESGIPTKVKNSWWIETQPILKKFDHPDAKPAAEVTKKEADTTVQEPDKPETKSKR